jgi:putative ABC transport system permease protein
MRSLRQIVAVMKISLLGVPQRLGACTVIVVGIAGVVAVLISVFAMARGFAETAAKTGRADRAIVLGKGTSTEAGSALPREAIATILNAGRIKKDPDGRPIASADYIAFARLTDRRTGLDAFATLRGTGPRILSLRPEIKLVAGRMFEPAVQELIVGRALQRRLEGLEVGSRLTLPKGDWTVVGAFESDGDSHESELLTDAETLLSAYQRNKFNSVTVLLDAAAEFGAFQSSLGANPALSVTVKRERDYLIEASRPTTRLLNTMAGVIGGIMALGAIFAAVNAMFSAISARSTEIGTLRAIGYDGTAVVISVFLEALLFALTGAVIGAAVAWCFFNGNAMSTLTDTGAAPISYVLRVSPGLMLLGIASACAIGLVGGLFPAIRIARASVVSALRGA